MGNRSKKVELTMKEQMLASISGAGITALTMTPFDVVKVRLQSGQYNRGQMINYCNGLMDHMICCRDPKGKVNGKGCVGSTCPQLGIKTTPLLANKCPNVTSNSIKDCPGSRKAIQILQAKSKPWYLRSCPVGADNPFRMMVQLTRTEGITTLWSGLPATIVMAIPATVLYFTSFDQLNGHLANTSILRSHKDFLAPLIAGASARFITTTVISPLELIRTRMQIDNLSWFETINSVKKSYEAQGFRSLSLGYSASILRDVPFSAVYFGLYKNLVSRTSNDFENVNVQNFSCSSIAAMIAGALTLPLDVIKTRQQMMLGSDLKSKITIRQISKIIFDESGLKGFTKGFSPRLMKVTPACAIMMTSYEATKAYYLEQKI